MMRLLEFNSLFRDDPRRVICFSNNEPFTLLDLLGRVRVLTDSLAERPEQNWVLASNTTLNFLCGLIALLVAGKEILLPPNNQSGTINETLSGVEGLLTDQDISTGFRTMSLDVMSSDKGIQNVEIDVNKLFVQICTSGSTGAPKQVRKALATLENEINALEKLWGSEVNGRLFISTVSHQHIYGLLFRVLWPLLSGRPFLDENIEYPEQIEVLSEHHDKMILVSSPAYLKRMSDVLDRNCMQQHINMIVSSGGPLDRETSLRYRRDFAVAPTEVLGSTETGGIAWRQQEQEHEVLWRRFDEVEIRRQDTSGVLMVRSPFCFSQEWHEMGDAVELVDHVHFRLLGRVDRIVKLEEKRISLDRMETVLMKNDLIDQARIVVLEGERTILGAVCVLTGLGEDILANSGRRELSGRLKDHLAGYFDRVTLPRKWRYIADFPYNTQGKITQADLQGLFEDKN